jgi:hypothetical protein
VAIFALVLNEPDSVILFHCSNPFVCHPNHIMTTRKKDELKS